MKQLRLTGVRTENGDKHLDLVDDEENTYTLALDETVRAAVSRPAPPAARRPQASASRRAPMSPRDVQARIRAGATVEEMIEISGLDPAHVEHYAGPVHAERFHIAQRARDTQVAAASTAEQHRLAFGDSAATLEAMVRVRLRALGSDTSQLSWDAWRREDGQWQLACWFDAPEDPDMAAELDSPAQWVFHAATRHLVPDTPTAQRLHTLPSRPETPRRRRLTPVDGPFDVEEADAGTAPSHQFPPGGADSPSAIKDTSKSTNEGHGTGEHTADSAADDETASSTGSSPAAGPRQGATRSDAVTSLTPRRGTQKRGQKGSQKGAPKNSQHTGAPSGRSEYSDQEGAEHEDLLDILRARRGRRLGADEESDDKLALMLTRDEQPAEPNRPQLSAVDHSAVDHGTGVTDTADSEETDAWGFSYAENGEDLSDEDLNDEDLNNEVADGAEGAQENADGEGVTDDDGPEAPPKPQPKGGRARRPSMPRWDDILFGSRED